MSEYGKRIISANGARQVDNKRMVPQLISVDNLAGWSYADTPVQDGWVYRIYQPPAAWVAYSRPCITFTSLPSTSREVYISGIELVYQAGVSVDHPVLYTFALDYVTYSSANYGRRAWNASGALIYDSGNPHLNIHQIFSGMSPDVSWTDHEAGLTLNSYPSPLGSLPLSPAIYGDSYQVTDHWGDKTGRGSATGKLFYRFTGGNTLQSILCQTKYVFDTTITSANPYLAVNKGPATNMSLMVIDRYIYD
jgi:hypothetical protein